MKPGRPSTPTRLKLLRGNPGHRSLPEHEPMPATGIPECPDHLDKDAQQEWMRLVPELEKLGLITLLDRASLAAYCSAYSMWRQAEQEMPLLTKKLAKARGEKRGQILNERNLIIGQRRNALKEMNTYLQHFGLSPASRPRVQGGPQQTELPMGFESGGVNESPLARARRLAGA